MLYSDGHYVSILLTSDFLISCPQAIASFAGFHLAILLLYFRTVTFRIFDLNMTAEDRAPN